MYDTIAFVDFDGTITMEDTLEGAIRLFASPEEFHSVKGKLVRGEMTLSQVVRYAFDGAPSSRLERMLDYVKGVALRPGFPEFLDEMDKREIPVVVISGAAAGPLARPAPGGPRRGSGHQRAGDEAGLPL
mgnify:CR=1 FL=1